MTISAVQVQGVVCHRSSFSRVERVGGVTETAHTRLKNGTPTARLPYQYLRGAAAPTPARR